MRCDSTRLAWGLPEWQAEPVETAQPRESSQSMASWPERPWRAMWLVLGRRGEPWQWMPTPSIHFRPFSKRSRRRRR